MFSWRNKININIALIKMFFFNPKVLIFFLFFHENICCGYLYGYSLEAPHQGASNEYPQYVFLWRSKKNMINIFLLKKAYYLELWSVMLRYIAKILV